MDLLLISNETLINDFDEYVSYKESCGYAVATITIEDIYSNYSGTDNPEKVRNCIIDYYENEGIDYVIMGGDTDGQVPSNAIVPHRGFAVLDDTRLPAEMYFSKSLSSA